MWIGFHQPQEEEVFTLRTSYQGQSQGRGSEVEMSSIAHCFGGTLLAQIKQQSSMSDADISEPVHWKWKKKKVGLSSVMSELKLSTLQGFCAES